MAHITLVKQLTAMATGAFISTAPTIYFIGNFLQGSTPIASIIGPASLGATAIISSDEFYSEVKDSYILTSLGLGVFSAAAGLAVFSNSELVQKLLTTVTSDPSIAFNPSVSLTKFLVGVGAVTLVNSLIVPFITDKIHEYTHSTSTVEYNHDLELSGVYISPEIY